MSFERRGVYSPPFYIRLKERNQLLYHTNMERKLNSTVDFIFFLSYDVKSHIKLKKLTKLVFELKISFAVKPYLPG